MATTSVKDVGRAELARRGLVVYFGVVLVGSALLEGLLLRSGASVEAQGGLVALLMWLPALASLCARLLLREGARDISLRGLGRRGWRLLATGWLFPVGVGALAYGAAWGLGLVPFTTPQTDYFASVSSPLLKLVLNLGLGLTVLTLAATVTAVGEELGWRGYMLTRLIDAGLPRPVLVSGLVWGAWHLPLVLSGQYTANGNPWLAVPVFMVTVVAFSYLLARLRLQSGSVWPAVVAHGGWNAVILNVFDPFAAAPGAGLWVGEAGLLVALATVALAALLWRGQWSAHRAPRDPAMKLA